jgi:hypothetical protein
VGSGAVSFGAMGGGVILVGVTFSPSVGRRRSSRDDHGPEWNHGRLRSVGVGVLIGPFRGSRAVAAGLVTAKELRGPRFRCLFRDTFVAASLEVDLVVRSVAASVATDGCGVLGGWSAAEVLGASCGPEDAPAEIVVPGRRRARPGLRVRHEALPASEVVEVVTEHGTVRATSARRTAFDLRRRPPFDESLVAVDALSRVGEFAPRELVRFGYDHLGAPGSRLLARVVVLASPLSGSPMETRIRLALHHGGLPPPVLQHPVGPYALDLAYPAVLLAVEYDGREHLTPERARHDLRRQAALTAAGWAVLRFGAWDVHKRPWWVAAEVRRELGLRAAAS